MAFQILGIPQPTPVKNTDTGLIEDGYRFTVQDTSTGAKAVLEVPQSQFNTDTVQALADFYLGKQNEALAAFRPKPAAKAS